MYSHFFKNVLNLNISNTKLPLLVAVTLDCNSSSIDIAELKVSNVDTAYNYFSDIVKSLAKALNEVDNKFLENPSEVIDIARTALAGKVTWLNFQQSYQSAQSLLPLIKLAKYLWG